MLSGLIRTRANNCRFVILSSLGGFVVGLAVFFIFGADWLARLLTEAPVAVAAVALALPFALAAAMLGSLFATSRRRAQTQLLRAVFNNMTQGLCMFDRTARLVLCNERYIEMYRLRADHARAGTPLRELLAHRLTAGTFAGDPDRYVAECLRQIAEGRTELRTNELRDGRVISVVSRPMRTGGWVATHTDVTEQLLAEKERDSLRQRDERRRNIDAAIAAFRARVESVLNTVSHSGRR